MKVVFVLGPTASGKSHVALDLAAEFGGAILNADSVQIYEPLSIGSAAPTQEEKARVPHYFFQTVPAPRRLTAGDYSREAHQHLKNLEREGRHPVVFIVGGTGFYVQALEKGLLPIEKADPELQDQIEQELAQPNGAIALHSELLRLDPVVGNRISANDHYRLVRAIEIIRRTGKPLSQIENEHRQDQAPFPYPLLKLGLQTSRETLRERVIARTRKMLSEGLLQETKALLDRGLEAWEPLQSVGYKEACAYLQGDGSVQDQQGLEDLIVQNTMRLAKRQKTWFQRDEFIHWGAPEDLPRFRELVRDFLKSP